MSHILTGTFNHSRWSELFIGLATGINGSLNGLMKRGEPKSADLEVIFRECGGDLTAYFARRHGASDVAADLVQESFLQLARRLRKGEALRSPRAYLFGIARHVSMAFFRKNRSSEGLPNEVEEPAAAEPDARMAAAREVIADLPATNPKGFTLQPNEWTNVSVLVPTSGESWRVPFVWVFLPNRFEHWNHIIRNNWKYFCDHGTLLGYHTGYGLSGYTNFSSEIVEDKK